MHQEITAELREQLEVDDLYGVLRGRLARMSPGNEWRPALSQFVAAMLRDVSAEAQGRSAEPPPLPLPDRPLLRAV